MVALWSSPIALARRGTGPARAIHAAVLAIKPYLENLRRFFGFCAMGATFFNIDTTTLRHER
jgi:hypothetical protein